LIIPLVASTTSHQTENAHAMAQKNPQLFHALEQKSATQGADLLAQKILKLL